MKNPPLRKFYRLLHHRGMTTTKLAEAICSSRAHVTMVLNGTRPRAGKRFKTWERLKHILTFEEMSLLEQCSPWNSSKSKD